MYDQPSDASDPLYHTRKESTQNYRCYRADTKLKQLECLCSENTPDAPWLPILWIHIRSQVKTRQILSNKFEKFVDTPSEVA